MRLTIGVYGSATGNITKKLEKKAFVIGQEIAEVGAILVTGATTGLSLEAAKGAKSEGGLVVGVSPAENEKEHLKRYNYPLKEFDFIVYTGFGRKGRNVVFIRSCDGVICLGGKIGTLNEFTIAYDENRPLGVLQSKGTSALIPRIVKIANKGTTSIIYETDPKKLVKKLIKILK
jgi:uncharacterized protein (TIGR00725 family)